MKNRQSYNSHNLFFFCLQQEQELGTLRIGKKEVLMTDLPDWKTDEQTNRETDIQPERDSHPDEGQTDRQTGKVKNSPNFG